MNFLEKMKPNGEYLISVLTDTTWQEVGSLAYDGFFRDREIDLNGCVVRDSEALSKLADDRIERVKRNVAKHPNTPADVLKRLAADENKSVRGSVVENPNTPVKIIEILAKDREPLVSRTATSELEKRRIKSSGQRRR